MKPEYLPSQENGFSVVRARLFGQIIATEREPGLTQVAAKKALASCKKRVEYLKSQARA
jgi:hypothetical protein